MAILRFQPFELDTAAKRLSCSGRPVDLRRRTWEVLEYLLDRRGQLVSKQDIFDTVWSDAIVSDVTLSTSIRELRSALGDDARQPTYIQTVYRRGFRFIAEVSLDGETTMPEGEAAIARATPAPEPLVGRDSALAELAAAYERAAGGEPEVVFLSGEAGIGKSSVLEAFVRGRSGDATAIGHCVDHCDGVEAFAPVLEALEQLIADGAGSRRQAIDQYAPTWMAQMPWFSDRPEEARRLASAATTRPRMRRELVKLLEVLGEEAPLVIGLEDLHLADAASIDLLSLIASRPAGARLLVIATYRPADAVVRNSPLSGVVRTLLANGRARRIDLPLLSRRDTADYLAARTGRTAAENAASLLFERTEGHPLYLRSVVDLLEREGKLADPDALKAAELSVPENVRASILAQLGDLDDEEREVLEAASVAGIEFDAQWIAVALGRTVERTEQVCELLVSRRHLLRRAGTSDWPDGSIGERYRFAHSLYHNAVYGTVTAARRRSLHRSLAEALEVGFASALDEAATHLAEHFRLGGVTRSAIEYSMRAARVMQRRSADAEACAILEHALELANDLGDERDAALAKLRIELALGPTVVATHGYTSPGFAATYRRALDLAESLAQPRERAQSIIGLSTALLHQGRVAEALLMACDLLDESLAAGVGEEAVAQLRSHLALVHLHRGDIASGLDQIESILGNSDPASNGSPADELPLWVDPVVVFRGLAAALYGLSDRLDEASLQAGLCLERARQHAHPFSLCFALTYRGLIDIFADRAPEILEAARESLDIARQHGFDDWEAFAQILLGAGLARTGEHAQAIDHLERALGSMDRSRTTLGTSYFRSILADAYLRAGLGERALEIAAEATARGVHDERVADAELKRIEALALADGRGEVRPETLRILDEAAVIAAGQGAHLWARRVREARKALRESAPVE